MHLFSRRRWPTQLTLASVPPPVYWCAWRGSLAL